MSNRELCIHLLGNVPDYKLGYVLAYLQGLTADEEEDDRFCQQLLDRCEEDPDPDKDLSFSLADCKREWGLA